MILKHLKGGWVVSLGIPAGRGEVLCHSSSFIIYFSRKAICSLPFTSLQALTSPSITAPPQCYHTSVPPSLSCLPGSKITTLQGKVELIEGEKHNMLMSMCRSEEAIYHLLFHIYTLPLHLCSITAN